MTSAGVEPQAGTLEPWIPRGGPPSQRYQAFAARFRSVFDRIQADVVDRERHRRLPIDALRAADGRLPGSPRPSGRRRARPA